jgi:hypothetical protein
MNKAWSRCLTLFWTVGLLLGCGRSPELEEAATKRRAEHIAKLKGYVPANVLKTVDPEFYTYSGFRDWWRFPLVYPYSIQCIDSLSSGHLCQHDGKSKISDGHAESYVQGLGSLLAFNIDAHFLVGHTDGEAEDPKTGAPVLRWILFDFTTGQIHSFKTKEELGAAAKVRGYSGDMEMPDIKSHYEACFD